MPVSPSSRRSNDDDNSIDNSVAVYVDGTLPSDKEGMPTSDFGLFGSDEAPLQAVQKGRSLDGTPAKVSPAQSASARKAFERSQSSSDLLEGAQGTAKDAVIKRIRSAESSQKVRAQSAEHVPELARVVRVHHVAHRGLEPTHPGNLRGVTGVGLTRGLLRLRLVLAVLRRRNGRPWQRSRARG